MTRLLITVATHAAVCSVEPAIRPGVFATRCRAAGRRFSKAMTAYR